MKNNQVSLKGLTFLHNFIEDGYMAECTVVSDADDEGYYVVAWERGDGVKTKSSFWNFDDIVPAGWSVTKTDSRSWSFEPIK